MSSTPPKVSRKARQPKRRLVLRRKSLVMAGAVILILLAGGAAYFHRHKTAKAGPDVAITEAYAAADQVSPQEAEAILKRYLVKQAQAKTSYAQETYSASGSKLTMKALFDVPGKRVMADIDLDCAAHVGASDVTLQATVQQENTATYIRLHNIAGTIMDADGRPQYLSDLYAGAKDTWIKQSDANISLQAQIDSGVYVTNSAIMAPKYDSQLIADRLADNSVFEYHLIKRQGDDYMFTLRTHQTGYLDTVRRLFPDLQSPEAVVGNLFDESNSEAMTSTLTIHRDGTLVEEDSTQSNFCRSIIIGLTGADPSTIDAPSTMSGTSTPKPDNSFTITPVPQSKPWGDSSLGQVY